MSQIDIPLNTLPGLGALPDIATIQGNSEAVAFMPRRDPNYVFRADAVRSIFGWLNYTGPDGLYLFGDRGTGKSSGFIQFHAWLNRPMFSATGHATMEFEDLLGTKEIVDGDTITCDGPLVQAARLGVPFLFEEIDRAPETVSVALNSILDGYPIVNTLNGGEIITPKPGFGVVATGNTNGSGDHTGDYNTANVMDQAFMDRVWAVEIDYPTPDQELHILTTAFGDDIPKDTLKASIAMANDVRFLHKGTTDNTSANASSDMASVMETTISTRSLIRFWGLVQLFPNVERPIEHALKIAVTNKCSPVCATAIQKIAEGHFGVAASV